MRWLETILLLVTAVLAVFWQAVFPGLRSLLGAQVDLLPALMVYAGLCTSVTTITLLAVGGGLAFDALSSNPLGVSLLPLMSIGMGIYAKRDLVLRDQMLTQVVLGTLASFLAPCLTLLLLLTMGENPLLSWGTVWQLVVLTAGGGVATPLIFVLFEWLRRMLTHEGGRTSSFRPDREIRRGRL